jgi:hypothetical protein
MMIKAVIIQFLFLAGAIYSGDVHIPDFSQNFGGYVSQGSGISLSYDINAVCEGKGSLRIECTNAMGTVKSSYFTITAVIKNGTAAVDKNLAFWNVAYAVKKSEDFTGTFRIAARILDDKNFIHPDDPLYNQIGEPFDIPFVNYGGEDIEVDGFTKYVRPFCTLPTTHPNNRRTGGNNLVEFTIYLFDATGDLWLSGVEIKTEEPFKGDFTEAKWNEFETSKGQTFLGFQGCEQQPSYATIPDAVSPLIMDSAYKLFRAAGFNQSRFDVRWDDDLARNELSLILETTTSGGIIVYEGFEEIHQALDTLKHYGISAQIIVRGTPDWTHPAHCNSKLDCPRSGFSNPGNHNGLGDPYPGPHYCDPYANHWTYPPDYWNDYREFARQLTTELKGKVECYEIFNEINVAGQDCLVGGYIAAARFVEHFAQVAKENDPNADVIVGCGDKMLAGVVAEGTLKYADGLAYHGYTGDLLGTRAIVQSCGEKKHIWMSEYRDIMPDIWGRVRQASYWNVFSLSAWKVRDDAKIIVVVDSQGNWIDTTHPKGLGDRLKVVQDYTAYGQMSGALNPDDLAGAGTDRIHATVIASEKIGYGLSTEIKLQAYNNTETTFHNVKLWPVGFVDNLGFELNMIREAERVITEFAPGARETITLKVKPCKTIYQAAGTYDIGLVVVSDEGKHSLALQDVEIMNANYICGVELPFDLNSDCRVDQNDLIELAANWLSRK